MVSATFIIVHIFALVVVIAQCSSGFIQLIPGLVSEASKLQAWGGAYGRQWMSGLPGVSSLPPDTLRVASGAADLLVAMMSLSKSTRTLSYALATVLYGESLRAMLSAQEKKQWRVTTVGALFLVALFLLTMQLLGGVAPNGKLKSR